MRRQEDAFGRMIYDYYRGDRSGAEIIERDDGYFDASGGPAVYFREYKDWSAHERKAMQLVRGRVLDVGCGAGRNALYLQDRGLDVVGIDVSPLAVKIARKRGVREARRLSVTKVGPRLGVFGTILMMGNNLGLFGSRERARWLLRRFKRLTTDDARIIAESVHVYRTADPDHRAYHRFNRERGRMGGQIRIRVRYKRYVTPWFDYLFVSQSELRDILDGTGWHAQRFLESGGPTYIAVMEKD